MIKYLNFRPFVNDADGKPYVECTGLSSDTKPNEVSLNSLFLELDTKTLYYCSKSGGEEEKVVYEGNVSDGGELQLVLDGTITVVYDGTTYVCEPKTAEEDGETFTYYGATITIAEGETVHDWEEYPFVIDVGEDYVTVGFADEGRHSLSISSLVTTEAEWTKYGEQGSGSEDMINVYFTDSQGVITDLTTQMAEDGSITLPQYELNDNWYLLPIAPFGDSPSYPVNSTFTLPENKADFIFTEDDGIGMTAPYINFSNTKPGGGLS